MQSRRNFIKQSCSMCASIAGMGILASQFSGCAPLPMCKGDICKGVISVPLSSFTDKNKIVIVRNKQLEFDILLVKQTEDIYYALLMKCTHQENPLTANPSGLFCSTHGSTFDLHGNVTKEPALNPLKKFKTKVNNSSIEIVLE